ncbi:hypothetical protein Dsin_027148 [Dipteronia sinensis]|uniref:Uncharacterized protein n=1 Tax=Dipteronia sinensis TaxID=43782 RepID=A0AAE0A0J7_9ROSI|nr:hypothetical protein Dsin_027148 [Dipteronia sinensis]
MHGNSKVIYIYNNSYHSLFVDIRTINLTFCHVIFLQSRSEIGNTWHLLPIEEKAKFGQPEVVKVVATNLTGEQPHHCENDISNNFNVPPTDEQIPPTTNRLDHGDQTISTRCTPSRWYRIVNKLSEEQKEAIRALGFGTYLPSIVDGDLIAISGDVPNKEFWESKFSMTSRGIFLKDIEHCLEEITTADDEFKVTLCLFLLGTILPHSATDYVHTGYLIPLSDVGKICMKNWSSWCLSSLCKGIEKFKINRQVVLLSLTTMGAADRG